jgi:hypothetical protein
VLLGNGDGTFRGPFVSSAGKQPYFIAAGDFNRDGLPDLAVSNDDPSFKGVVILQGRGDGTFAPPVKYVMKFSVGGLAVADVNGDGRPDLVLGQSIALGGGQYQGEVHVLPGNRDGTFGDAVDYAGGPGIVGSLAVADLNGDGRPDFVEGSWDPVGETLSIILSNPDGTYGPATVLAPGWTPGFIVVADVDGDGRPDLVVSDGAGPVSVLRNQGAGRFGPAVTYAAGARAGSAQAADFDGDGLPELVVVNSTGKLLNWQDTGTVTIIHNAGDWGGAPPAGSPDRRPWTRARAARLGRGGPEPTG